MKKNIPTFKSDAEAERFVATADLSKYDLSGLNPVRFEFEKKERTTEPEPTHATGAARRRETACCRARDSVHAVYS